MSFRGNMNKQKQILELFSIIIFFFKAVIYDLKMKDLLTILGACCLQDCDFSEIKQRCSKSYFKCQEIEERNMQIVKKYTNCTYIGRLSLVVQVLCSYCTDFNGFHSNLPQFCLTLIIAIKLLTTYVILIFVVLSEKKFQVKKWLQVKKVVPMAECRLQKTCKFDLF